MIRYCILISIGLLLSSLLGCEQDQTYVNNIYKYIPPNYKQVNIELAADTLHFPLGENSYNQVESVNIFSQGEAEYLSFFDERSASINVYEFASRKKVKEISLKQLLKGQRLFRTSVYLKNLDSIFIANNTSLYLFDSSGRMNNDIEYLSSSRYIKPSLDNTVPVVIAGSKLYTSVRRSLDESSKKELKKWKILYEFDLKGDTAYLHYNLPELYRENYYGYHYMYSGYCFNHNNRFVFSFGADTSIYETDLKGYNISYTGKSQYQVNDFKPLTKSTVKGDESHKRFMTSGSYGPIYFDAYNQRYLRVYKQAISESDYESKNRIPKQSLLIFDSDFKIIGENVIDANVNLYEMLFTNDGKMYARINRKDEYALHFIQLTYRDGQMGQMPITLNKSYLTK